MTDDDEPLVECEMCHDLFCTFQVRVHESGRCYCDKCTAKIST